MNKFTLLLLLLKLILSIFILLSNNELYKFLFLLFKRISLFIWFVIIGGITTLFFPLFLYSSIFSSKLLLFLSLLSFNLSLFITSLFLSLIINFFSLFSILLFLLLAVVFSVLPKKGLFLEYSLIR